MKLTEIKNPYRYIIGGGNRAVLEDNLKHEAWQECYDTFTKELPINNDDIALLLSLMSSWAKEVPEGLDPTMYGTGTYDGDLRIKQRVDEIKRKMGN